MTGLEYKPKILSRLLVYFRMCVFSQIMTFNAKKYNIFPLQYKAQPYTYTQYNLPLYILKAGHL